jgi:ubiquinone/menaquinone biosynthesis C-methylase UbiE
VLEVGVGSGLNIPHYGPSVRALWGLDPSIELWRLARRRTGPAPFPVRFVEGTAERIPAVSGAFDTIVTTWTLCSIPELDAALAEMRRVLAPGGRLLFVEHGRSPDRRVRAWQDRLTPLWRRLAGGCHLNRSIDEVIRAAGFRITRIERGYAEGPRFASYLFKGEATARFAGAAPGGSL